MDEITASGDHQRCSAVTSAGDPYLSKRNPNVDEDPLYRPGIKKKKPLDEEDGGASGNLSAVPRKRVLTALDKGKWIMVEEEEEEEDDDEDDGGDDSEDSSDEELEVGGNADVDGEEDSDFFDDPLAEVDLENILPSRTRLLPPPPPGAYLVSGQDGDDSEDDSE